MLPASFEESGDRYKGKSRDFILLRTLNNDLFSRYRTIARKRDSSLDTFDFFLLFFYWYDLWDR